MCKYFTYRKRQENSFLYICSEYYLAFFILPCWSVYSSLLRNGITKTVLKTPNQIILMHLIYLLILINICFKNFEYLFNLSSEKIIIYSIVAQSVRVFCLF